MKLQSACFSCLINQLLIHYLGGIILETWPEAYLLLNCADSSDDSYVSAGEDPMEAPVFEFPLQDSVVSAGADVLLKCIIAGTPIPEGHTLHFFLFITATSYVNMQMDELVLYFFSIPVTWTKDNTNVSGFANFTVKVEGERHSVLIKSAKMSDGGKYCVTAVNQEGKASSSATLTVKAGKSDH